MLSLRLVFPGKYLAQIEVVADSKISNIRAVEDNDVHFLYNGYFLNESKSFSFYNLSENDTIVVVPTSADDKQLKNKYKNITHDMSKFLSHLKRRQLRKSYSQNDENSQMLNDPSVQREVSRIRDVELLRMEYKPKFLRKIQMRHNNLLNSNSKNQFDLFLSKDDNEINKSTEMSTIIGPQTLEPSIDPLPIFNFND